MRRFVPVVIRVISPAVAAIIMAAGATMRWGGAAAALLGGASACTIGPNPSDDGGAGSFIGTWNLVGATCAAGDVTFTGLTETLEITASTGTFTATVAGCSVTTTGNVQASGDRLQLLAGNMPSTCNPNACSGSFSNSLGLTEILACPGSQLGHDQNLVHVDDRLDLAAEDGCTYHFER